MNHDELLQRIGRELELSDSKFEALKENYNALAKFIDNNHSLSSSEGSIYTQGSFAIDTAIKPLRGGEFDVDIVVEFGEDFQPGMHVNKFYEELKKVFNTSRYKEIMEEYKNVIRINYQGDYHFDIMPALINSSKVNGHIKCVNTKKSKWEDRAPKLYRDWFINKAGEFKLNMVESYPFQFRDMAISELEKPKNVYMKPVLTRTIQLVKRARDYFFKDEDDCIPQSIVFTTLIAELYKRELFVKDFLLKIAHSLLEKVELKKMLKVNNPVKDIDENFTEKWTENPRYQENFERFVLWFYYKVNNIVHNDNLKHVKHHILTTFGSNIIDKISDNGFDFQTYSDFWKSNDKLKEDKLIEDDYQFNLKYPIKIIGEYDKNGYMKRTYYRNKKNFSIYPNAEIHFSLEDNHFLKDNYRCIWKIRNMISNYSEDPVRGDIRQGNSISENTSFRGDHYVECYVIQYNKVVGYDRIMVNITV